MGYTVRKTILSAFYKLRLITLYVLPFSRYCRCSEALWAIGQNAQLMSPHNSYDPNRISPNVDVRVA